MNDTTPDGPCDVAALTVPEFTCELDLNAAAAFDTVCQRFILDVTPDFGCRLMHSDQRTLRKPNRACDAQEANV